MYIDKNIVSKSEWSKRPPFLSRQNCSKQEGERERVRARQQGLDLERKKETERESNGGGGRERKQEREPRARARARARAADSESDRGEGGGERSFQHCCHIFCDFFVDIYVSSATGSPFLSFFHNKQFSDKAPTNKIRRRALLAWELLRTRSCHEWESLVSNFSSPTEYFREFFLSLASLQTATKAVARAREGLSSLEH